MSYNQTWIYLYFALQYYTKKRTLLCVFAYLETVNKSFIR